MDHENTNIYMFSEVIRDVNVCVVFCITAKEMLFCVWVLFFVNDVLRGAS